jgi:hypothetical protein
VPVCIFEKPAQVYATEHILLCICNVGKSANLYSSLSLTIALFNNKNDIQSLPRLQNLLEAYITQTSHQHILDITRMTGYQWTGEQGTLKKHLESSNSGCDFVLV